MLIDIQDYDIDMYVCKFLCTRFVIISLLCVENKHSTKMLGRFEVCLLRSCVYELNTYNT